MVYFINFKTIFILKNFIQFKQTARKIEFAQFYTRTAGIVESYEPETLNLTTAFNKTKELLPLVEELKIQNQKIPLTRDQKALSNKLDKAVSVLMRYTEVKLRQDKMASEASETLHTFIKSYLRGYGSKNLYQKTGIINKMMTVFKADAALMASAESEELTGVFGKIGDVYNELDLIYKSRRKVVANREKLRTDEIKRKLYYALRELLASIEVAELSNADINYGELINEINQEILRFNAGSKVRTRPGSDENPESPIIEADKPADVS